MPLVWSIDKYFRYAPIPFDPRARWKLQYPKSKLDHLKCELHTLIYTFPFETKLQYLGLSLENAEFLAPLFYAPKWWFYVLTV